METQKPAIANIYPLKFYTKFVYDDAGNVKEEQEWVLWAKKGVRNPYQVPQPVKRAKRDPDKWLVLEPYYKQWKHGKDMAAQGTPLEAWPAISEEERALIQKNNIFTLEDFAQLTDTFVGELGFPQAFKKRDAARDFIRVRDEQDTVSELQQRIKDLEAQAIAGAKNDFNIPTPTGEVRAAQETEKAELRAKLKGLNVRYSPNASIKRLRQMVAEAGLDEPTDDSSGRL